MLLLLCSIAVASVENEWLLSNLAELATSAADNAAKASNDAIVDTAHHVGLNDGDLLTAQNMTGQAAYDVFACSSDVGCASCYGIASAGALVTSTATTAACGMFAIACPLVFAYGMYTSSRDAVKVFHDGIEGIDPCKVVRQEARRRYSGDIEWTPPGWIHDDGAILATPSRLQAEPRAAAGPGAAIRPDGVAVVHIGSMLAVGILTISALHKRLQTQLGLSSRQHRSYSFRRPWHSATAIGGRRQQRRILLPVLSELSGDDDALAGPARRDGDTATRVRWAHPIATLV